MSIFTGIARSILETIRSLISATFSRLDSYTRPTFIKSVSKRRISLFRASSSAIDVLCHRSCDFDGNERSRSPAIARRLLSFLIGTSPGISKENVSVMRGSLENDLPARILAERTETHVHETDP